MVLIWQANELSVADSKFSEEFSLFVRLFGLSNWMQYWIPLTIDFIVLQNVFHQMFALWWSCTTEWYGDARSKLCIPFNVLCMLYLLPTITKRRTIYSARWSIVLSTWFWKGYLFIATSLPRWWIFNGWNATKRWTTWTEKVKSTKYNYIIVMKFK